jgi:protein-tyrosine phosphatase
MAEFVFLNLVKARGLSDKYSVSSAATSYEEIGNPIYPPARDTLNKHGIFFDKSKRAVKLMPEDYEKYDLIIGMDNKNIRNMNIIFGSDSERKISRLMDYTARFGEVSDPWYTGKFEEAYSDILEGCTALLDKLEGK